MKAPRSNPAAAVAAAASSGQLTRRPPSTYAEDSSSSEMAPASDDGNFTMSELDDEDDDDDGMDVSDDFEDSSDDDWGAEKRKRKPKKPTVAKGSKRAKGGRAPARTGSSTPRSTVLPAPKKSAEYSDSEDSDFFVGKRKPKRGTVRGRAKKPKSLPSYMDGSDSEYGSSDFRSLRQSTREQPAKSYAEDAGDLLDD
ncbi:hypothetical protein H4R20_006441, partial [Coemansia guatemalensis]